MTSFVTGFFDLQERETSIKRPKSIAEFLHHGNKLLDCDINLIIFTELKFMKYIWSRRQPYQSKTFIVSCELESLGYYQYLDEIITARNQHPFINGNPIKDTPLFTILMLSKLSMLETAMAIDPFEHQKFAWIDFGIAHVVVINNNIMKTIDSFNPSKIRLSMMKQPLSSQIDLNRTYRLGCIAGGFWHGSKTNMLQFTKLMHEEFIENLNQHYALMDEQLLTIISLRYSDICEYYYSDYQYMLVNYNHIVGDLDTIIMNLNHCNANNETDRASDIVNMLRESIKSGHLTKSTEILNIIK